MEKEKNRLIFVGTLSTYYETGMEYFGLCLENHLVLEKPDWVKSDKDLSYKELVEEGDYLFILDKNDSKKVLWENKIEFIPTKVNVDIEGLYKFYKTKSVSQEFLSGIAKIPRYIYQPVPKGMSFYELQNYLRQISPAKLIKKD